MSQAVFLVGCYPLANCNYDSSVPQATTFLVLPSLPYVNENQLHQVLVTDPVWPGHRLGDLVRLTCPLLVSAIDRYEKQGAIRGKTGRDLSKKQNFLPKRDVLKKYTAVFLG